MGKKEQEKKAKRAAAGPSDAPPCKAAAPKPPVPKVDTPAAGSGSRPSSASSGAVEAERLVAGSGNTASNVSSGRVEAEGCGSWEYNEGVGGQYTCAGCGARTLHIFVHGSRASQLS